MKIEKGRVKKTDVLFVDGVIQSIYPPRNWGYWKEMIPENFKGKHVLLLGVAGGTIARLLLQKYPHIKITGVDNSGLVMNAASRQFKLDEVDMKLVIEDGFEYVKNCKKKFDLIVVDMWNGYWFPIKSLSPEFISDCKRILTESGQIYVNSPNLDFLASETITGPNAFRDDLGRNVIYRMKLTNR